MHALVFGAKGTMGREFLSAFPDAVGSNVDIADARLVAEELDRVKPEVVINAAGKTGRPNIDWCEDHREETLHSNVTGPLVLLEECGKRGIHWVHLSSGCIYAGDNGGKGFSEEDEPNFSGSFYSRTKAWADQILREFPVLILRIRMPFDGTKNPRSLISKLVKYPKVLDVQNSLTYLPDFIATAKTLIERHKTGIYNIVNPGTASPFEVMEMYKRIVDPKHEFERLTLDRLSTVTKAGRSNCILTTEKLSSEGISLRPVKDVLNEAMEQLKAQS